MNLGYDLEFIKLLNYLKETMPQLLDIDGIGKQLNLDNYRNSLKQTKMTADVSVDPNGNVGRLNVINIDNELAKPIKKLDSYYVLWKQIRELEDLITANDIIEMQVRGDIYINDVHGISSGKPYCFNYSTYDIAIMGLPFVDNIKCQPPKHFTAFKSQLEQFTVIASNSTLGATGLADLLPVASWYVEKILNTLEDSHFKFNSEQDVWTYVREMFVSFIYTVNQPMRADQSPFTNISIYDKNFLKNLSEHYIFPDGKGINIEVTQKLQKLWLEIMNEELKRTPITFPIATACISVDKNGKIKDMDFVDFIAEHNYEYGFINIYKGSSSTVSACCRLRSDTKNEYFNSFGAGTTKIGSQGVCTINLAGLAFHWKAFIFDRENEFFYHLERIVEDCALVNHAKRLIIQKHVDNGFHPLYTHGFIDIKKQYSTVGINGMYEAIELFGYDITTGEGIAFAHKIIDTINKVNDKMMEKYNAPHNCEQIPGESASIKLAKKDFLLGKNEENNESIYVFYSNQFIPLTKQVDMLTRIRIQGQLDSKFSGGAINHINITGKLTKQEMKDLIILAIEQGNVYFAVNYVWQLCKNSHLITREDNNNNQCLKCGEIITDEYTRVVGFSVNTKNWHEVRQFLDYPNRVFYN